MNLDDLVAKETTMEGHFSDLDVVAFIVEINPVDPSFHPCSFHEDVDGLTALESDHELNMVLYFREDGFQVTMKEDGGEVGSPAHAAVVRRDGHGHGVLLSVTGLTDEMTLRADEYADGTHLTTNGTDTFLKKLEVQTVFFLLVIRLLSPGKSGTILGTFGHDGEKTHLRHPHRSIERGDRRKREIVDEKRTS